MSKLLKASLLSLLLLFISFNKAIPEEIISWEECLIEAEKNHPDLISAKENINEQRANKDIAASGLYPQTSANIGASRTKTSTTKSNSYSYGISGTQLIFDGFKTRDKVSAVSEDLKASEYNYRLTSASIRFNLRSAFINLLKAKELIRVEEEIVKIRKENLELINLRYKSGFEHRGALLTAEANLAEANFELSQAKRNIAFAQRQLTKEMGLKEFKPMYVKGDFTIRDTAKEKPNFEDILKNHPSILMASAKKNSASFNLKSAYGNFAPQLSTTADINKKNSHWPPENDQWDWNLSLTLPLFEGGLKTAQVSEAQAVYNQREADERSIRDAVIVSLEQTWTALQDVIEKVETEQKLLAASEERSKIAQAQYSTGFITFDNWIIIENDLVNRKKAYLESQANASLREADWIKAKGEPLEYAQ